MPWKYIGEDNTIEVVLDPDYRGDLFALAKKRPVWIVATAANRQQIDDAWLEGRGLNLFSINQYPVQEPFERVGTLLEILGVFDDQYVQYHGFVVHGLLLSPDLSEALEKEGFEVVEERDDGFAAIMVPEVRGPLIWRNYSAV